MFEVSNLSLASKIFISLQYQLYYFYACTLVQSKHEVSISRILRLCCLIHLSHFSVKWWVETVIRIIKNAVLKANLDKSNINKNMYKPPFLKCLHNFKCTFPTVVPALIYVHIWFYSICIRLWNCSAWTSKAELWTSTQSTES